MPRQALIAGTASTPDVPEGIVSGFLLRLIRERLGYTQDALAALLPVDLDRLKSWETGRRPLARVQVSALHALRRRLHHLGADPVLLATLDTAIDADLFIADVLRRPSTAPDEHILAGWVTTRAWNDLLAWTLGGAPPTGLGDLTPPARRGPTPARPMLAAADRQRFFDNLRTAAEAAGGGDSAAVLLRRQAYFMAAWDRSSPGRAWLARMDRTELRHLARGNGWTPTWVAGRSIAVARACQGDPDQLAHFIATRLADSDPCEAANLNYWAYWIGEHATPAASDEFMAGGDLGPWRGTALLRHLTAGLRRSTPYLALSVHTVWALLERRPYLLADDPTLAGDLQARTALLLDDTAVTGPAKRELEQVHYATRMTKGSPR